MASTVSFADRADLELMAEIEDRYDPTPRAGDATEDLDDEDGSDFEDEDDGFDSDLEDEDDDDDDYDDNAA